MIKNTKMPREVRAKVFLVQEVAPNTVRMLLDVSDAGEITFQPGQFAHVAISDKTLRRPFSIASLENGKLEFIFQIVGDGTRRLALLPTGTELSVLLPLGHGWPMEEITNVQKNGGKVWLVSGGIGMVPLMSCAKEIYAAQVQAISFLGFRERSQILNTDVIAKCGPMTVQVGGLVTTPLNAALSSQKNEHDLLLTCGPKPFLKVMQELCKKYNIRAFASFEEAMGCGIGACLTCSCGIRLNDKIHYARVCRDGPVFNLSEVVFDEQ